jgi:hypothetical protein
MYFKVDKDILILYKEYNYERSQIFYSKEIDLIPYPWTNHPILSKYKFTNVNRRFDRESKWLISNIIENDDILLEDKILNIFMFRLINRGETISRAYKNNYIKFGYEFFDKLVDKEIDMHYSGQLQSNAYTLVCSRNYANLKYKKYRQTMALMPALVYEHKNIILSSILLSNNTNSISPEKCISILKLVPSIGVFLSYQIWLDFTYLSEYEYSNNSANSQRICKWSDNDYGKSGPGSNHGIDWMVHGKDLINKNDKSINYHKTNIEYDKYLYWFRDNINKLMKINNIEWDVKKMLHFLPKHLQYWGIQEVENSFCELDKFLKLTYDIPSRHRIYHFLNYNTFK